jgi:hypothetical protein
MASAAARWRTVRRRMEGRAPTLAVVVAEVLALCGAAMIAIGIGAPGVVRHAVASAHQHSHVVVERLQWISSGVGADDMAITAGIVAELVGTVALIMLTVAWADRRKRRDYKRKLPLSGHPSPAGHYGRRCLVAIEAAGTVTPSLSYKHRSWLGW